MDLVPKGDEMKPKKKKCEHREQTILTIELREEDCVETTWVANCF